MYELTNVLLPSKFAVFDCCYFLCYQLHRAETYSNYSILKFTSIYDHAFYGLRHMLISTNVNNDVTMNLVRANSEAPVIKFYNLNQTIIL